MRVAVIIGFNYVNPEQIPSSNYRLIKGVIIDLYMIYKYICQRNYDKIIVVTDIYTDVHIDKVTPAIIDGLIDLDIANFIEHLDQNEQIYFYDNKDNFSNFMTTLVTNSSHLMIYYTGHAINNKIIFPVILPYCSIIPEDKSEKERELQVHQGMFTCDQFIKLFTDAVADNCQILLIFDCCNGPDFNLPFVLDENGIYRLNNYHFPQKEIICLVSSLPEEKSLSTNNGSLFTHIIIKNLNIVQDNWLLLLQLSQRELNQKIKTTAINSLIIAVKFNIKNNDLIKLSYDQIDHIYREIKENSLINNEQTWLSMLADYGVDLNYYLTKQTIKVYSSYPTIYHIWPWFYKKTTYQLQWDYGQYLLHLRSL